MIGQYMKQLRLQHQMTQAELAERLGLSTSAVGMYEQGRREPEISVITQMCRVFNVPADSLLFGETNKVTEVRDVIRDVQDRLLNGSPLTLDGEPLSPERMQQLADAIRVSAAVVLDRQDLREKDLDAEETNAGAPDELPEKPDDPVHDLL